MSSERPRIGISACLAGEPVRYDGSHRLQADLLRFLARFADLSPVCPEVAIGLGTPRPTIRLVLSGQTVRVRGVADPSRDLTDALAAFCEAQLSCLGGLDGHVFKARSPSCGVRAVPRLLPDGREDRDGQGYFSAFVQTRFPGLPVADEETLRDAAGRAAFEAAVRAHWRQRTGGNGHADA